MEIREGLRPLTASMPWRITPNALLTIGTEDGPAPIQFGRFTGVTRFDDGSVAVADELASNVRIFDPAGRLVHTVGRNGAGEKSMSDREIEMVVDWIRGEWYRPAKRSE